MPNMPRRLKVLLGIFLLLLCAYVGWYAHNVRLERQREARQKSIVARAIGDNGDNAESAYNLTQNPSPDKGPEASIVPVSKGVVEPVYLRWKASDNLGRLLSSIDGCAPIAPDADLVWDSNDVFTMREPGRLERIWPEGQGHSPAVTNNAFAGRRLCFDGRYVWLFDGGWGRRRLMVIDPVARESWEFANESTGLFPQYDGRVRVGLAPVRPGVVCAFFAAEHSSLATLRFDPDEQAREVEPINLPEPLVLGTSVEQMFALEAQVDNQTVRRIVIGRDMLPQLLLDPENGQISVAAANSLLFALRSGHWCIYQGAIWWQRKVAETDSQTTLVRATLPDLKEEAVLSQVPSALLSSQNNNLLLVGTGCWQWSGSGHEISLIAADNNWTFADKLRPPSDAPTIGPPDAFVLRIDKPTSGDTTRTIDELFRTTADASPRRSVYGPAALYPSSVYGTLMVAAGNAEVPERLFRIAADETSNGSNKPRVTVSRLTLATAGRASTGESRSVAMLDAALEPLQTHPQDRLPLLAREVVRQSLLLAAWSELGCAIADGALGESLADTAQTLAEFRLSSWFRDDGSGEVALHALNEQGAARLEWQQDLQLLKGEVFDYRLLVEKAEGWSRDPFVQQLRKASKLNNQPAPINGVEEADVRIEQQLSEMTFAAQFAAVRRCSRSVAEGADADQWMGRLARAYANLGLLTEHHWTLAHKTFQARALLIAQRMVARDPTRPWGLWHRAYALALAGLPGAALDDLAKADGLAPVEGEPRRETPPWLAVVEATCHCDGAMLATLSQQEQVGSLAALLRFLELARLQGSVLYRAAVPQPGESRHSRYYVLSGSELTKRAALNMVEREPECFRAYDAMSDCCDQAELRVSTANALAVFERRFPERLRALPDVPASIVAQLDSQAEENTRVARLAESLLAVAEPDACGLSWQALGTLVRETLFLQCWRRAHFLYVEAKEKTGPFLADARARVAHHPSGRLLDFYADRDDEEASKRADEIQKSAAAELVATLDLATLTDIEWRLYILFFATTWQAKRPDECVAALTRVGEHEDGVLRDLLERIDLRKRIRQMPRAPVELEDAYMLGPRWALETARQINAISPGNPDAIAAAVRANPGPVPVLFEQLFDRYRTQPQVLRALGIGMYPHDPRLYEALAEYVKLSPDAWAYRMLARFHFDQGRMDQWQAVVDEYLSQAAGDDLAAADVRITMVYYFLPRGEANKALPYALAAAATDNVFGIGAAVRCYESLGDDEQERIWRERLYERDPKSYNAREAYLCCRRTGRGDAGLWYKRTTSLIEPGDLYAQGGNMQVRFGAFYWLSGRRDEALHTYQLGARIANDPRSGVFCALCAALVAEEIGDQESRDQALAEAGQQGRAPMPTYHNLAKWLAKSLPDKMLDVAAAKQLAAAAFPDDKASVNFLVGYAMLLVGQRQHAIQFLNTAATISEGEGSTSRLLAIVALRDGRLAAED